MVRSIRITKWQTRDPERLAWQLAELEKQVAELKTELAVAQKQIADILAGP